MLIAAKSGIVVVHLVHGLKTHHLLWELTGNIASCCLGEILEHTGRPDTSSFALAAVFLIQIIYCIKATASWANRITAATGNTSVIVFLPEWQFKNRSQILCILNLRYTNLPLIFFHKRWFVICLAFIFEVIDKLCILYMNLDDIFMKLPAYAVIFCFVASHGNAITVIPALFTFHHEDLYFISHPFIINVAHAAVGQKHIVQTLQAIDITWSGKNNDAFWISGDGFLTAIFIKGKNGLGNRVNNFLWRKVRLTVCYDFLQIRDFLITNQPVCFPHSSVRNMLWCINSVLTLQLVQDFIHSISANLIAVLYNLSRLTFRNHFIQNKAV